MKYMKRLFKNLGIGSLGVLMGLLLQSEIGLSADCYGIASFQSPNQVWGHALYYCNNGTVVDFTTIHKPGFTLLTPYNSTIFWSYRTDITQDQFTCAFYSDWYGSSKQGKISREIRMRQESTGAIFVVTLNIDISISSLVQSPGNVSFSATYNHDTAIEINGATSVLSRNNEHGTIFKTIPASFPLKSDSCKVR